MTSLCYFAKRLVRRARFNDTRVDCAIIFWKGTLISLDAWLRAFEYDAMMVRRDAIAP
jgi:hypothetical protein